MDQKAMYTVALLEQPCHDSTCLPSQESQKQRRENGQPRRRRDKGKRHAIEGMLRAKGFNRCMIVLLHRTLLASPAAA